MACSLFISWLGRLWWQDLIKRQRLYTVLWGENRLTLSLSSSWPPARRKGTFCATVFTHTDKNHMHARQHIFMDSTKGEQEVLTSNAQTRFHAIVSSVVKQTVPRLRQSRQSRTVCHRTTIHTKVDNFTFLTRDWTGFGPIPSYNIFFMKLTKPFSSPSY